jgi:DNA-binding NtrC family response regulator
MRSDTILIIDDEPMIRHLAARILDRAGYRTISAASVRWIRRASPRPRSATSRNGICACAM